jgi:ribulose kinase
MQIMADALGLPIRLAPSPEMGIVGAACLAREGTGEDLLERSRRFMRDAHLIEPNAAHAGVYRDVAARYFDVRQSLREPLLARQGRSPARGTKPRPAAKPLPLIRDVSAAAPAPKSVFPESER